MWIVDGITRMAIRFKVGSPYLGIIETISLEGLLSVPIIDAIDDRSILVFPVVAFLLISNTWQFKATYSYTAFQKNELKTGLGARHRRPYFSVRQ